MAGSAQTEELNYSTSVTVAQRSAVPLRTGPSNSNGETTRQSERLAHTPEDADSNPVPTLSRYQLAGKASGGGSCKKWVTSR